MNYKKKIQEIELEINMINKYYINQIKDPDDKITKRLNILREEHYILLEKICLLILNHISSFHTLPNIPLR